MCACPNGATPTPTAAPGSAHASYHSMGTFGPRVAGTAPENIDYPSAFVDRPLILPSQLTQPELAVTLFNDSINTASSVNERIVLGSQTGFLDRWQAGLLVASTVRPRVSFDTLMLGGEWGVIQGSGPAHGPPRRDGQLGVQLNARLDAGVRHGACAPGIGNAFAGGLGAPLKLRLNPHLALISGRTTIAHFADDLLTWDAKSCDVTTAGATHLGSTFTLGLPVGFQASLGDSVDFAVRTGYRQLFGSGLGTGFVPLGVDFAYVISGQADVGVSFDLPNALGSPSDLDRTQTQLFEQRLTVFAQTRL
jgi:hypothetical protein